MNVQELVAQTFDEGGNFTGISGRIGSGPTEVFAHSDRADLLNELAESRHHE